MDESPVHEEEEEEEEEESNHNNYADLSLCVRLTKPSN
jgi:hypothetical protein